MRQARLIFEDTGERRHPKVGEYYRWLRGPHVVLQAPEDKDRRNWTDPSEGYAILRLVEDGLAEEVQVRKTVYALAEGEVRWAEAEPEVEG